MQKTSHYLTLALFPLIAVPVWMAGGTYKPWQYPFLWICLWAWVWFFIQPETKEFPSRKVRLKNLIKDPITWVSILFISYLTIQFLNTGRIHVLDFELNKWTYTQPPVPWLPWSFTDEEAREMIQWFAPILTLTLILRQTWTVINTKALIWLVCLNGFCNAMLAFIHQSMGWDKMYNFQKFGKDIFGSFGYPNHGAVYFILLFGLALGLFLHELIRESSERDIPTLCFSAIWAPVFFLAANLSTSRAGILGAWLVLLLSLTSLILIAWPRTHPVQRVYGLVAFGTLIGLFVTVFILFAKPIHIQELKRATVTLNVAEEIDGRFFQVKSAYKMWLDHPIYGTGGWGYRYLGAHYMPESEWYKMLGKGKANVHNDWVQFLAEFGLIGFGLLMVAIFSKVSQICSSLFKRPTLDESIWGDPLRTCVFWALTMLFLDSLFDIPLRSPAVFMHAILLLTIITPNAKSTSVWRPVIDWKRLQSPALRLKNKVREISPEDLSAS